jgi:hypothetical protein
MPSRVEELALGDWSPRRPSFSLPSTKLMLEL